MALPTETPAQGKPQRAERDDEMLYASVSLGLLDDEPSQDGAAQVRRLNATARSIDFICSTEDLDSHCTVIDQASWKLERYAKNPVVFYNHNAGPDGWLWGTGEKDTDRLPIARADNVRVEGGKLRATFVFPPQGVSERADDIWQCLVDKRLNAASVGFRCGRAEKDEGLSTAKEREIYRLFDCELFEISIVALPSNPEAIAERSLNILRKTTRSHGVPVGPSPEPASSPASLPASLAPAATVPEAAPAVRTVTKESTVMDKTLIDLLAKRFACAATEEAVLRALVEFGSTQAILGEVISTEPSDAERAESERLTTRSKTLDAVIESLGLAAGATEADVTRALKDLSVRAGQVDELRTRAETAEARVAEVEGQVAEREVNWVIAQGTRYGTPANESSRRSLTVYRKADPKGFAEDYALALKGLAEFDDTKLLDNVTGGTKRADVAGDKSGTAGASPGTVAPSTEDDSFDQRVHALLKKRADEGHPIKRSEAMELVSMGKDLPASK